MHLLRIFYNLFLSPDRDFVLKLRDILGFTPRSLKLYKLAFLHKSSQNITEGERILNNERLEYLGDSVLSTAVADYLYRKYPSGSEGYLTKMRAKIVQRKTLNQIGDEMGLDVYLKIYNSTSPSHSMLGNAFEALVGAVYIERGYEATKKYIISKVLQEYLDIDQIEKTDDNFKSFLLEWAQKYDKQVEFKLVDTYKLQKRDRFKISVLIDGDELGAAENFNKKSAEQEASSKAIVALKLDV